MVREETVMHTVRGTKRPRQKILEWWVDEECGLLKLRCKSNQFGGDWTVAFIRPDGTMSLVESLSSDLGLQLGDRCQIAVRN